MGENNVREKEYYKEKIIDIVNSIERLDILEYLYIFIKGKVGKNVGE